MTRPSGSATPSSRLFLRPLLAAWLLVAAAVAGPLWAGGTGSTDLHMPQGSGAGGANGDDVTDDTGMDTFYRYWIEVPPGLSRLVVEIFDPDIGGGGGGEAAAQRDRARDGFDTDVDYDLIRPDGTVVASLNNCDTNTCDDNGWEEIFDSTSNLTAGHWELRIDMTDGETGGNDINAIGIRAHDNDSGSGGTELNVYYDSFASFGVNPPTSGQNLRDYDVFPYVTSGCSARKNDFDWDSNSGNTGGIVIESRTGSFTQTYTSSAMSGNNAWRSDSFSGWTSDQVAGDYGIWNAEITIGSYTTPAQNGNYGHVYFTNFQHTGTDPTTNPQANAFRVYLGTDAGAGVAPVKPYLEQLLTHKSGSNPVPVGQTSRFQVTVRLVNPTTRSITFSTPSNIVTANVPGGGAVYAGNAAVGQGTIVSQPSVGGTGNVTWNPGTVTGGTTTILTYQVDVTPASAGQRIPVTATPASGNGTRAQHVDETGNTTQARATYLLGPLCELATTQGVATEALVSSFRAFPGARGGLELEWTTASEAGTAGFYLHRWEAEGRRWVRVHENLLAAVAGAPQGGRYRFLDGAVHPAARPDYRLEEVESDGRRRLHGPYPVVADWETRERPDLEAGFAAAAHVPPGRGSRRRDVVGLAAPARKDPDRPSGAIHVSVRETGLQYLSVPQLAPYVNLPLPALEQRIARGKAVLSRAGQAVAWHPDLRPNGGAAGLFFYGEAETDSLYTAAGIYKLDVGNAGLAMRQAHVGAGTGGSPAGTFPATRRVETDAFAATVLGLDPESDYWFWEFVQGDDPSFGTRSFAFDAPGAEGSAPATLALDLHGATASGFAGEHDVAVSVNGVALGGASWTGIAPHRVDLAVPAGTLLPAGNVLEVAAAIGGGAPFSIVYVDGFDLAYARRFEADGDALDFTAAGLAGVTVSGLSTPAAHVLDVSDPHRPRWLEGAAVAPGGAGGFEVSFVPDGGTRFLVAGAGAVHAPELRTWSAGTLREGKRRDYLVVAPRSLAAAADRLAALREAQGLLAEVVTLEEIYDHYAGGVPTPHALRAFLAASRRTRRAPRYVALAGEGTLDYRDLLGFGENLLPPLMVAAEGGLFPSDNRFGDADGDGLPETAVGRIPVATAAELDAYVDKIAAYEAASGAAWAGNALFLADADPDGVGFAADSAEVAQQLPSTHAASFVDLGATPLPDARAALFAALDGGTALINYLGHGGLDRLAAPGLLTSADVPGLGNGERLPVLTAMTCTVNRFAVPGVPSLGELLVKHPGGGAAAVLGPSGLSFHAEAQSLAGRLYRRTADLGSARLGDLVLAAYREYFERGGDPELLDIYNLLGDPALRVVVPTPPPPVGGSPGE